MSMKGFRIWTVPVVSLSKRRVCTDVQDAGQAARTELSAQQHVSCLGNEAAFWIGLLQVARKEYHIHWITAPQKDKLRFVRPQHADNLLHHSFLRKSFLLARITLY